MNYFNQRAKTARRNLVKAKLFYHISSIENRESIQQHGLRESATVQEVSGPVMFFLTNGMWKHNVARDIMATPYDLWATAKRHLPADRIHHDNVAELYSAESFYVELDSLPANRLIYLGEHKFNPGEVISLIEIGGRRRLGPCCMDETPRYA